jgi:hypothetical protein
MVVKADFNAFVEVQSASSVFAPLFWIPVKSKWYKARRKF